MKATTILLAALLTFSANLVLAENDITAYPSSNSAPSLTPVVPAEADFEESFPGFINLEPLTPEEATFEEPVVFLSDLMPRLPMEASFGDFYNELPDFSRLVPITPSVADFE